ncbi:FtsK-like domain-containing protein [Thalassoglobus neptunius]|uniref:FtsK-like domain-containing protein n=1 Tax=Thalassoglobus neptunius TaxID=1938619 RepID=A0A5C5X600_9PLAN|nr:FtsK/SpoIIIE domain-containing protein [Thalassoglobus neptunius]TWT58360.1 FtsK-like domain-containing protein [Thalassoglobus neptunius]
MSEFGDLFEQFQHDAQLRHDREEQLRHSMTAPSIRQKELQDQLVALREEYQAKQGELESTRDSSASELTETFQQKLAEIQSLHDSIVKNIQTETDRASKSVERQREDSEWVVESVLDDGSEGSPQRELEKETQSIDRTLVEQDAVLSSKRQRFDEILQAIRKEAPPADLPERDVKDRSEATDRFQEEVQRTDQLIRRFKKLVLAKIFTGFPALISLIGLIALFAGLVFQFADPMIADISGPRMQSNWIGVSTAVGAIAGLVVFGLFFLIATTQRSNLIALISESIEHAGFYRSRFDIYSQKDLAKLSKRTAALQRKIESERQAALERYEEAHRKRLLEIEQSNQERLADEERRFEAEEAEITTEHEAKLQAIQENFDLQLRELNESSLSKIEQKEAELKALQKEQVRSQTEQWVKLKTDWKESAKLFQTAIAAVASEDQATNPEWTETFHSEQWAPSQQLPRGIRLGGLQVDLQEWPVAVSEDIRLAPRTTQFEVPAIVEFPGNASTLFLSSTPEARLQALGALQTMMLRLLLQIPPGKLRFTLIDPIRLGETFGGFMHLSDYDELMVTNRIWTESGQIEQRLADLTEHMENVFQTYLRNEFQTIEEYNQSAGEVAEPYHFLVIADFPAKFSEIAARRLVSIVNSGPRCGVYTLLNLDPTKPMPNQFEVEDILPHMTSFEWKDEHFHPNEPILSRWPIRIQSPPAPDEFTSIVKMVGEASKDARKVEVSFNRIAPQPSDLWSRDSRRELEIPLGRAGATKLQTMKLGRGTSQHMLVAGKTGSGKSTFLHILITNLALYYGPDEVNFFLIDFKKGVEFKDYASFQLPHARVIAIESDREFGVSALQRLDEMLQERGELFRREGVQDIGGYRDANPDKPLPRVLLVVDEFQEFFIEDDRISQSAALLLDRLVRQGRAFGIHVILGSQTLGGAYSLARTTLGQVAVRVALQCSDADAHLILSEENTAARLLTRPGEAIYNDANGMMEGNHPFQIAWISDEQRSDWLADIEKRASRLGIETERAIVFEGNIPSDLKRNKQLRRLAEEWRERSDPLRAPKIWLGDAVEIKPPSLVALDRHSGRNILVVGQDSEAAMGILHAAALSIVASTSPTETASNTEQFETDRPGSSTDENDTDQQETQRDDEEGLDSLIVLDGSSVGSDDSELWKSFQSTIPCPVTLVSPREVSQQIGKIHATLQSRMQADTDHHDPVVVVISDLSKFRDLKKADDDFGLGSFGSSSEPTTLTAAQMFAELLAEGPLHAIHLIIWCDSRNNVDRWFSRQNLKELEQRIVLQMNAADSSHLIDSPAASRLGTHRALLYREETGEAEKFRPYGVPGMEFLNEFGNLMRSGGEAGFATDLEEFTIS